ncbi:Membrane-bound transcription factor site-2 protease [Parasponia andersonii]|uniref:Endopeptidase S2P n=1 Tax=Parasponia andersonii TaxID=3476 RepID=A0A2P5B774_PARAD|nr:Membrane-bound transcription factor site-2 protease [Parasponia andersonii]
MVMILVWELGRALRILPESQSDTIWTASLLGFWPYNNSYSSSFSNSPVADAASLLLSTLISISFHEFGHALAAASEGIEMDYIAIFILLVFPGAFVAFNFDLLQALPHFASLRLYCAGIWHNAVVLALPSSSPLSGHLSPGDVIVSLDGATINTAQEWMDTAALINQMALDLMNSSRVKSIARVTSRKGYCIPDSVLEESKKIQLVENHSGCPYDLAAFATIPCSDTRMLDVQIHCLNAKEVVKFGKCGDGWVTAKADPNTCICSQVYFLDGESVLEVALSHFTSLGSNKRGKVLRMCLLAGTLISFLTFFRIFLKFL